MTQRNNSNYENIPATDEKFYLRFYLYAVAILPNPKCQKMASFAFHWISYSSRPFNL